MLISNPAATAIFTVAALALTNALALAEAVSQTPVF